MIDIRDTYELRNLCSGYEERIFAASYAAILGY